MQMINKVGGAIKLPRLVLLLLTVVLTEGCGSGYEIKEENGHVYIQCKSWWKKMFFGLFCP